MLQINAVVSSGDTWNFAFVFLVFKFNTRGEVNNEKNKTNNVSRTNNNDFDIYINVLSIMFNV